MLRGKCRLRRRGYDGKEKHCIAWQQPAPATDKAQQHFGRVIHSGAVCAYTSGSIPQPSPLQGFNCNFGTGVLTAKVTSNSRQLKSPFSFEPFGKHRYYSVHGGSGMQRQVARSLAMLFLTIAISSPLSAQHAAVKAGIVQVTEGQVSLDGNPLHLKYGVRIIQTGQTLSTKRGRVELIIASSAYFSLGENASLKMEQNELNTTELTLEHGAALIEIVEKLADPIRVRLSQGNVEMNKPGLYRLDSGLCEVRVYGGVVLADNGSKRAEVKKDRKVRLEGNLIQSKFAAKALDALHQWSAHRSFDIFLANPETDNWEWRGLPPTGSNPYPMGSFVNPNYRTHFPARMPPQYARRISKIQGEQSRDRRAVQDAIEAARKDQEQNSQTTGKH
jgi:hypothetical protein